MSEAMSINLTKRELDTIQTMVDFFISGDDDHLDQEALETLAKKLSAVPSLSEEVATMRGALQLAEPALAEGFENCGGDETDNVYAEPLKAVRAALNPKGT